MPKNKPTRQTRNVSVVHPLSAGIDIGSRFHVVAVPPDLDDEPTRSFSSFTGKLEALVQWLIALGITTVAMESTGVYWIPLYELLIAAGIEVYLVNARHAKNVPGRKSDVSDAQWLQQLHSYGLLQASFLPDRDIGKLRSYTRLREQLTRLRARSQQHIQKALMQMNVQLHHVVTDVMGLTGRHIISAILVGVRDPKELAKLRDGRCKNSSEIIEQALHGNYEEDHLFELEMAFSLYNNYSEKILLTEGEIEAALKKLSAQSLGSGDGFTNSSGSSAKTKVHRNRRPTLSFDVQPLFTAITGRDVLQIPGLGDGAMLTILSECGTDMRRWKTAKHFTSWLGLAPQNKVTGGRLKSSSTRGGAGRAANAFFLGAMRLSRMDTALGSFKRRLAGRAGKGKALVATARKLAVLFYKMMSEPFTWNQQGSEAYEQQMRERQVKRLIKKAEGLGLTVVPSEGAGEINAEAALA
jgi:transposase